MQVHDSIKALRDCAVLQRGGKRALEGAKSGWLDNAGSSLRTEIESFSAGQCLNECPILQRLMVSADHAVNVVSDLFDPMSAALAEYPLAQVPFRHQYQPGIGVLQLAAAGTAVLSLVLYEQCEGQDPVTVCFADSDCHEIVLAGSGTARMFDLDDSPAPGVKIGHFDRRLSAGDALQIRGNSQTKQMIAVKGRMVILRLSRTPQTPTESREFQLSDCALLHRASGDRLESRQEMYVTLLGAMARGDAAPVLADIAQEGSTQLRWHALRNALALDSEVGFRRLTKIVGDPQDTLAVHGGALRPQLLEAHPEFAEVEAVLCPA